MERLRKGCCRFIRKVLKSLPCQAHQLVYVYCSHRLGCWIISLMKRYNFVGVPEYFDLVFFPQPGNKVVSFRVVDYCPMWMQALWQLGLDQDFRLSCPLKADSKIVHLICWEWLLSTSSFLQSGLICPYFISQHAYNIGFLAWLELVLESGPPGPKCVLHEQPVKQTNKQN